MQIGNTKDRDKQGTTRSEVGKNSWPAHTVAIRNPTIENEADKEKELEKAKEREREIQKRQKKEGEKENKKEEYEREKEKRKELEKAKAKERKKDREEKEKGKENKIEREEDEVEQSERGKEVANSTASISTKKKTSNSDVQANDSDEQKRKIFRNFALVGIRTRIFLLHATSATPFDDASAPALPSIEEICYCPSSRITVAQIQLQGHVWKPVLQVLATSLIVDRYVVLCFSV